MRLFFAFYPESHLYGNINRVLHNFNFPQNHIKITKEVNFHCTILFLGEIQSSEVDKIISVGDKAQQIATSFSVCLNKWEIISKHNPKVLALSSNNQTPEFDKLQNFLFEQLNYLNIAPGKPLHFTIGRSRNGFPNNIVLPKIDNTWQSVITSFELIQSDLKPNGPIYKTIKKWLI